MVCPRLLFTGPPFPSGTPLSGLAAPGPAAVAAAAASVALCSAPVSALAGFEPGSIPVLA